jgi:hypothetical protein
MKIHSLEIVDFFNITSDIIIENNFCGDKKMTILLLDIERQKIALYSKDGMVEIPFINASQLYTMIEEENVYYITNAMEVNAKEVVALIKSMGVEIKDDIPEDSNTKYIHVVEDSIVPIEEDLRFRGRFDIKLVDQEMQEKINTNPLLKQLISIKKVEIIGEIGRRKLRQEQHKQIEIERKKEEDNKMILKKSVSDFQEGGAFDDEAETIDILGAGSAVEGGKINTMTELSELMQKMDDMGE